MHFKNLCCVVVFSLTFSSQSRKLTCTLLSECLFLNIEIFFFKKINKFLLFSLFVRGYLTCHLPLFLFQVVKVAEGEVLTGS